ncbi:MAG TPA: NAD(P)H-hydrate dehydratase [bacterium]
MIPPGLLPPRSPDAHKGDCGRVVVFAGSIGLSGAAALCAEGAQRAGAGLVTVGSPRSVQPVLAAKLTEAMTWPLAESREGALSLAALADMAALAEDATALAIGPGLSRQRQTAELVRRLLPMLSVPAVLDADGLNAVAEDPAMLGKRTAPLILTPHPGEMGRLIRQSAADVQRDRSRTARALAERARAVVVLKGRGTVVADVGGEVYVNETGNPGMASGGFGDVLTGLIAGLLAQGLAPYDAARLGVYVHGAAADLAAKDVGEAGLIASDALARIPQAIRAYQQQH